MSPAPDWQRLWNRWGLPSQTGWAEARDLRAREAIAAKRREDRSPSESLLLARSRANDTGRRYVAALAAAGQFVPGVTRDQRRETIRVNHDRYARAMMAVAMEPLKDGVDADALIESLGIMTVMAVLSPTFRHQVGDHVNPVRRAVVRRIDRQAAIDMYDRRTDDKSPSRVLRRRYDAMMERNPDYVEPLTPTAVGLTEVALLRDAADRIRRPGVDADEIRRIDGEYRATVAELYEQAAADGLDPERTVAVSRRVLAEQITQDPDFASLVTGLSEGSVRVHVEQIPQRGRHHKTVATLVHDDGTEADLSTRGASERGSRIESGYTLRLPRSIDAHERTVEATVVDRIMPPGGGRNTAGPRSDASTLCVRIDVLENYVCGRTDDKTAFGPAEALMMAMRADGQDAPAARRAYSHGLVAAVRAARSVEPERIDAWLTDLGTSADEFEARAEADPRTATDLLAARIKDRRSQIAGLPRSGPTPVEPTDVEAADDEPTVIIPTVEDLEPDIV
ncbi:MAG: hypothetical protein E7J90_08620 [Cutibacterium avidum]|nr:hypothetical protein [Cutibacterium avidum]